jgi:aryl-alcohol dehydrogenase-like predicted oxidoreductase
VKEMSTLQTVTLGKSGLQVTPIVYGTWQISPQYWNFRQDDTERMIASIRRGLEKGINFFDTADAYGDGLSEQILGKALSVYPREKFVLATKVYHHFYPDGRRHPDLSAKYIVQACENSLRRLNMDYIDLYQCHSFEPLTDFEETTEALEKLKSQGKIKIYGVSNYSVEQLRTARKFGEYATSQNYYSLIDRSAEKDLLPYCRAEGIGILVYSPLHRGLLTGKYKGDEKFADLRAKSPEFQGQLFKERCEKVSSLREIADKYDMSITQLVLTTTLMNSMIDCAIVGIKKPEHIEEAAEVIGKSVSREDYFKVINTIG